MAAVVSTGPAPAARPSAVWLALGTLYLVWGSTYLAIRVAIDTLPPLLMAAARFLVAGGTMYAWAVRRGDRAGDRPTAAQWRAAFAIGAALLLVGNGAVVWAEARIPSGTAALLVSSTPLWLALNERVFHGRKLHPRAVVGLLAGFAGIALLVHPGADARGHAGALDPLACLAVVAAAFSWAAGSVYARGAPQPRRALVATGMQMLAGGALLALAGVARGEVAQLAAARVSGASLGALAYLVVGGSWLGFGAYSWLLRVAPTHLIGTYAYVNPAVAVLLGAVLLGEQLTTTTLGAGAVIVAAVVLIVTARRPSPPGASAASARPVPGVRREKSDQAHRGP